MAKVVEGVTVSAEGLKGVMLGLHNAGKDTEKFGRAALRKAGGAVKEDASRRFARYDQRTAAGYRVVVRRTGVAVEQSLRKTTGLRPDFGKLQMRRALVPALHDNEQETERLLEEAFVAIEEKFEATARVA